MRTIEVKDDAIALILDSEGTVSIDFNKDEKEEFVPSHVMLLTSVAVCITSRPAWLAEAVEWAMKEKERNVEMREKLQQGHGTR